MGIGWEWEWEYGHGNGREWDRKSRSRISLIPVFFSFTCKVIGHHKAFETIFLSYFLSHLIEFLKFNELVKSEFKLISRLFNDNNTFNLGNLINASFKVIAMTIK